MKIAAVVILYHPTENTVSNIQSYYDYAEKIFVFDNTETESKIQDKLLAFHKIEFHHDFKNEGIAKRLNDACEMAMQNQFEWLLTMDQDSYFSNTAIADYFNCFNNYAPKENIAMFGTKFGRQPEQFSNSCLSTETDELITSGMLVNLSLFKKIGNFDEALFIDAIDKDYCVRASMLGYSGIQFSNIYLTHQLGVEVNRSSIKSFFLLKKQKIIHSPLRCYYMYRNMLYLKDKYKNSNEKFAAKIREYVMANIKTCIFYGRDSLKVFRYLMLAYRDFKRNKMGRIIRER
ncbi:MAG: hypothetical protein ABJA79_05645 [Parafilimonas sp.]